VFAITTMIVVAGISALALAGRPPLAVAVVAFVAVGIAYVAYRVPTRPRVLDT